MGSGRFGLSIFLVVGSAVCISILALAFSIALRNQEETLPRMIPLAQADIQIEDLSFIQTHQGRNEWEIMASKAELFEDQKTAVLKDLDVRYTPQQGDGMRFRGTEGRVNTENHDFEISSGDAAIQIVISNGYTIQTRSMRWTSQAQRLMTEDPVQIHGPGVRISGMGMEALLGTQEVRVLSNVHAEVF